MITCIAVDDEPLALDIIDTYCQKVDNLELIRTFTSSLEALKFLKDNKVDLIFLDIQMPQLNGIEFISLLTDTPYIVFTTASEGYALQSYDYKTVDYLLKPFSFARFMKTIDKASSVMKLPPEPIAQQPSQKTDFIFVQSGGQTLKVFLRDILFIKGMSDYVVIHTHNKKIIAKDSLRQVADMLGDSGFVRVHKSFVVSMDKIELVDGNIIKISDTDIPVGKSFKEGLNLLLKSKRIG